MWRIPGDAGIPQGDFTIEAHVLLRSMYPDASVRTIVSRWSGSHGSPGWSLGVTSAGVPRANKQPIVMPVSVTVGSSAYDGQHSMVLTTKVKGATVK